MAAMTAWGFCELAVLSRYTNGFPCTWRDRIGKSLRISAIVRIFWSAPVNVSYVIIMFPMALISLGAKQPRIIKLNIQPTESLQPLWAYQDSPRTRLPLQP